MRLSLQIASILIQPALLQAMQNLHGPVPDLTRLLTVNAVEALHPAVANGSDAKSEENQAYLIEIALKALGFLREKPIGKAKAAKIDLVAVTLKRIYGLDTLPANPKRAQVRHGLVLRTFHEAGGVFCIAASRTPNPFKFDALSRQVYLSLAGLEKGTVVQADEMLVKRAFHIDMMNDLASAIVREAAKAKSQTVAEAQSESPIEDFAISVRGVARTLETRPYAGRVAIAQVYDAGVANGLDLGSLDDFKDRLAEAAREGLLDLERYDIAGPFEPSLKERSRLRFGRDERHFIVNQWN